MLQDLFVPLLEHLILLRSELFKTRPHMLAILLHLILERDLLVEQLLVPATEWLFDKQVLNWLQVHQAEPLATLG